MDLGVKVEGRVTIVMREEGGETVRHEFPNRVTNEGWYHMLTRAHLHDGAMVPKYLRFGLSDAPVVEPDCGPDGIDHNVPDDWTGEFMDVPGAEPFIPGSEGLVSPLPVAPKHFAGVVYGGHIDVTRLVAYSQAFVQFNFAPGELSGHLIRELSLCYEANGTGVFNRALILDENGETVPLVCLPTQSVTVYVRLRLHLGGWGQRVQLYPLERMGTITLLPAIADPVNGLWPKGLSVVNATMGGINGVRVENAPVAEFDWSLGPLDSAFGPASSISFRGRNTSGDHFRIDLDSGDRFFAPKDWILDLSISVIIYRMHCL